MLFHCYVDRVLKVGLASVLVTRAGSDSLRLEALDKDNHGNRCAQNGIDDKGSGYGCALVNCGALMREIARAYL